MQNKQEGFNPFAQRELVKTKRQRTEAKRAVLKRVLWIVSIPILMVAFMHAIGGTGQYSNWKAARHYIAAVDDGTAAADALSALSALARSIPDKRGNHSALAGIYCVYALGMIEKGQYGKAQPAVATLRAQFASEPVFSELWSEDCLVVPCDDCTSVPETCPKCGGTGHLQRRSGGSQKSARVKRMGNDVCLACNGSGTVSIDSRECSTCNGRGEHLSQVAVRENLERALRRAQGLALLKSVQSAISLRPLFGSDAL